MCGAGALRGFFPAAAGTVHFGEFLRNAGYYAVIFFYNLSGFLITYLLLQEKKATGDIALAGFYKRRALRIWPLYYLIVLLSLLEMWHLWIIVHGLPLPGGVVVVVLLMAFGAPGGLGYVNLVSLVFALHILSMLEWKVGDGCFQASLLLRTYSFW